MKKKLFDAIRAIKGRSLTQTEVDIINAAMAEESEPKRTTGAKGIAIIKEFEGLELRAYPDPATGGAPWTIGYGHTGADVKPGVVITEAKAEDLLRADLARFEAAVHTLCPVSTPEQFDALVSFAYNLGEGNLKSSTLRKMHNAGDHSGAAAQFGKWINANGKPMRGLIRRRDAEAALYRSGS